MTCARELETDFFYEEDNGMTTSSASVTLQKDDGNLIGISIGGGAPSCPCVYLVQIFENGAAASDGSLEAGDEIVRVNRVNVKGRTRSEVARMIQASKDSVTIDYNKLHADPKQGKTLDIVLKKLKHKIVENISSDTADALGMSRAILCHDGLVKRLEDLEKNTGVYKGLMDHIGRLLKSHMKLAEVYKDRFRCSICLPFASEFGDIFFEIGSHEPQVNSAEAFMTFGEVHRNMEKRARKLFENLRPMISDLNTYLNKAVPDTRATLKKYLDAKFEYLSYCLKIKEMDDEEAAVAAMQEILYRVETGNYEYRLLLRCRQEAKKKFAKLRSDVLVKLELLDQKRVQDLAYQLHRFVTAIEKYHSGCKEDMEPTRNLFPIDVDLSLIAFDYNPSGQLPADGEEDEEEEKELEEQQRRVVDEIACIDLGPSDGENKQESVVSNLCWALNAKSEVPNWPGRFSDEDFRTLVHTAIKSVLGLVGSLKEVQVGDYDPNKQEGSVLVYESDLNCIWAALCIYGNHFGFELAIRVRKVDFRNRAMPVCGFIATVALVCVLLAIVAYILADRKKCQPIKSFAGYHVLITGGSKGIGKAIALEAVRRGADVSIIARNADALEYAAEELRFASGKEQKVFWYTADLSEGWQRMSELIRRIELEAGPVDILINNVGNVLFNFFTQCLPFIAGMKRRASDQLKSRRVCFVSSQAGQIGLYGYTAYSASKFALRGFAEALQMECRPYNVWITIAYPPHTDTEGFAEEWNSTPELTKAITAGDTPPMKPTDVARHILDSVAKGEFTCHMGLEGWMLSTVCAGMSPANSWRDTVVQALVMGPLRLVGLFHLLKFNFTVSK
ncbi:LOW QUALITY PROTEIN: hypothetical protein M514_04254 [Trichuris suis]|uniref:PRKCA-binding protein n=1 Tax=Trichuris suis TaxID=68888 RepID=A0A085NQE6_9BILA|nr:LOW QUALITY PROTEIN: hypothetical protein M514_04254 [Trichuris suis]